MQQSLNRSPQSRIALGVLFPGRLSVFFKHLSDGSCSDLVWVQFLSSHALLSIGRRRVVGTHLH